MIIFFIYSFSYSEFFSRFDTSGSMIPLSVSEISVCDAFCDVQEEDEELGILVVGCYKKTLLVFVMHVT